MQCILEGETCYVKLHGTHAEYFKCCVRAGNASILVQWCSVKAGQIARKLQAFAALLTLLLASVPTLAESLPAPDLSACCNTSYCPLHHHQVQDLQRDKSNCDAQGHSAGNNCSMRACETAPNPVVGTALFVLVAPIALTYRASVEPAPILVSSFVPFHLNLPSTPPPRTFPS